MLTACLPGFIMVADARGCPGWPVAGAGSRLEDRVRAREIVTGAEENAPAGMCFMPATDPKTVKNRGHPGLASSAQDRDQEIERLVAPRPAGADIGQAGAQSWTILAGPEGSKFCVIRPAETLPG